MKWEGETSSSFSQTLGLRQGGTWSPTGYKFFINPLLNIHVVKDHSIGFHIGSEFCGSIAVADDLLFLSESQSDRQQACVLKRNIMVSVTLKPKL